MTDLKSKGIHLRASGIKSLKSVSFSPTKLCRSAELKLLLYTRVFLENVITYEFSPYAPVYNEFVTAYVSFKKLLEVTKEVVEELRENILSFELPKILNAFTSEKNNCFCR